MIAHRHFVQHSADHRAGGTAPAGSARSAAIAARHDQLRKLSDLHRDGVLTDEEFETKKAELHALVPSRSAAARVRAGNAAAR